MADEDELVGEGNAEAAPSAAEGADVAGGSDADGNDELLNEEVPEYESEEVVDDEPKPPTEEEIRQMEEEAVKAELRALGIPSEEELLENYPFPVVQDPTYDDTGREAYRAKTKDFDFFMFPITSVTNLFDLQVLNLRHSGLGDKGAIALAACLQVNKTITELSVVDNWITAKGGEALIDAVRTNTCIRKLDLAENRLGYRAGHLGSDGELGKMLFQLLKNDSKCKQLKALCLRANHIGDKDMDLVCEALSSNTWLHELDVSYNELGLPSGKAAGIMLAANMDLRSLTAEWNQLRGLGSFYVINEMADNNTLTRICLSWNGVEDMAAEAFGIVLSKNGALEEIDLSHNRITDIGAAKLADGLLQNQSLRRVLLSFNPLGDAGCKAVIQAIRETSNTILCYVDIKNADAGPAAHEELCATRLAKPNVEIAVPRNLVLPPDMLPEPESVV